MSGANPTTKTEAHNLFHSLQRFVPMHSTP